ncbi:MAG: hypothetical protein H0X66_02955 [Verrucomicrobia bacterium]|nr:hypothetical protein [Verrucomicrobiota bacterium]
MNDPKPYLTADSLDELLTKLKADCCLANKLPNRLRCERLQINKFLFAASENMHAFPLEITHTTEINPDFKLRMAGRTIGIEASRIANPRLEERRVHAKRPFDSTPYLVESGNSSQELKNQSALNSQFFQGYTADQQDDYWLKKAKEIIVTKTQRLNASNFFHYDETWLVLVDTLSLCKAELLWRSETLRGDCVWFWKKPKWFTKIVIESHDLDKFVVMDPNGCFEFQAEIH